MSGINPIRSRPLARKIARPFVSAQLLADSHSPLLTQKPRASGAMRRTSAGEIAKQIPQAYRKAVFCASYADRLHAQFPEWNLKKVTPPNNHATRIWQGLTAEQKPIWHLIKDEAQKQHGFILPLSTLFKKSKVCSQTLTRIVNELEAAGAISQFSVLKFHKGAAVKETFILPRLFFVGGIPQMLPPDQWLTRLVENRFERMSNEEKQILNTLWEFHGQTGIWPTLDWLARALDCEAATLTPILQHLIDEQLLVSEKLPNAADPATEQNFLIPTCDAQTLPLLPEELDNMRRDITRSWVVTQELQEPRADLSPKEALILDVLFDRLQQGLAPPVMAELVDYPELGLGKKANVDTYMDRLKAKGMITMLPNPMPGSRSFIIVVLQTSRGALSDFEIQQQLRFAHNPANWARFLKDLSSGLYTAIAQAQHPLTFDEIRPLFKKNPPRNIQNSLERLTRDGFLKIVTNDGNDAYAIHQNGTKMAMIAFQSIREAQALASASHEEAHAPTTELEKNLLALLHDAVILDSAPQTLLGLAALMGLDKSGVHHAAQVLEASGYLMRVRDPLPTSKAYLLILLRHPSGQFLNPKRIRQQIQALHKKENWISRLSILQRSILFRTRQFGTWLNLPVPETYLSHHRQDSIENACEKLVEFGFLQVRLSATGQKSYFTL